ncbi:MAG: sulfatase [Akkermansiaceae bacterium]|nr:sulfatase [Akkermansiaceae bacterium]
MKKLSFALLSVFSLLIIPGDADERPNILWITSEDNASHWLACYGNKDASTPVLDSLAAGGLKFTHAYSNGPVCAVARSTILNGAYAVTQGTQHMRSRYPIPASFKGHASYLREMGYYCTNNSKTDYNFKGNDASIWDDCSGKAHYKNRPPGKPFFAIFNLTITHESNLFPDVVQRNRKGGVIPDPPRLDPKTLQLPPHQPDLPEFREDTAIYHDCVTAMDKQAGGILKELRERGLAEDTIVFYYSDHGGATARGKRYLQDTGVRVPLIIHLPEKWRHLSPFKPGQAVGEMVSFVDLAPTLLSICGMPTPGSMQGRAFLGKHRKSPPEDESVFLFADRFDESPGMRRAITNGRWKYIRCFSPHLPGAPYCEYPLGQPSWKAWQRAAADGKLQGHTAELWKIPRPVEYLYDLDSDPWEIRNLAEVAAHQSQLEMMRNQLSHKMKETRDSGVIPETMWPEILKTTTLHEHVEKHLPQHPEWVNLAFAATAKDFSPDLVKALGSRSEVLLYWAAMGCLFHAKEAAAAKDMLIPLKDHPSETVSKAAAMALDAIQ